MSNAPSHLDEAGEWAGLWWLPDDPTSRLVLRRHRSPRGRPRAAGVVCGSGSVLATHYPAAGGDGVPGGYESEIPIPPSAITTEPTR